MFHNIKVAYPHDSTWSWRINEMRDFVQKEVKSMDRCGSCYIRYYQATGPDSGFNSTCDTPHALVWWLHKKRWWPAKAFEYLIPGSYALDYNHFNVIRFGGSSQKV